MHAKLNTAPSAGMKSPLGFVAASVLCVSIVVAALVYFGAHERLVRALTWIEAQGAWSAVLFILTMAAVVLLLLPGIFFTTGAGFVFGVVEGTLYVVAGTTLGAAAAFLIARHLFGARARRFILARSRLRAVNEEMRRHDWKVVMMTRLIPFFPGKLSNYFFGLTSFSFRGYVIGTAVGLIPFSLHNVYLGAVAAGLAALGERGAADSPVQWMLYGAGFLVTVAAVVYLGRSARRALDRYTHPGNSDEARP